MAHSVAAETDGPLDESISEVHQVAGASAFPAAQSGLRTEWGQVFDQR